MIGRRHCGALALCVAFTTTACDAPAQSIAASARPQTPAGFSISDDFASGSQGGGWHDTQQIRGTVTFAESAFGKEGVMIAEAAPREGRVPKADLIYRFARQRAGTDITVAFSFLVPDGYPANSVHLMDLECASCGRDDNPGIRLYLRHGRLRIDRSKIGHTHAWTNEAAPTIETDRWYRVDLRAVMAADDTGSLVVMLDGAEVLRANGATLLASEDPGFDRLQFGITATSNTTEAKVAFDFINARITR